MKSIKVLFGVAATVALLGFSTGVNAQENNNRDENGKVVRGAYETNPAGANWFIGVGAGLNKIFNDKALSGNGLATDVNVGKWFTPSVGARVGWKGWNVKSDKIYDDALFEGNLKNFSFIHADFMWNISNAFSGYKETRFWDIIPYAQFGTMRATNNDMRTSPKDWEFASGVGLLNDFRLGKHVDLFVDISGIVVREKAYYSKSGHYMGIPSVTAGLIFNLGKSNFDRHSTITPVVVPLPFTLEQYNALKDKVAALEKENAALKARIAELESMKPETLYVENATPASSVVYFAIDKAYLTDREKAHLEYYASTISKDAKITVTGSADSGTGSAKYNERLANARAEYVKNLLVKTHGLNADNITINSTVDLFNSPAKSRVVLIK